jgi:hypothetical protein
MIGRLLFAGLALFALRRLIVVGLALLAAGMLATSGGERRPARPPAPGSPHPQAPPPAGQRADAAVAAARAYALATRNWTPASYRAAWRRQRRLAARGYRRVLDAARPTRAPLRALRADRRSSLAVVTRTRRASAVRAPRARVTVWLAERTTLTGLAASATTRNTVRLRLSSGRWRVTGWSTIPGSVSG